MALDDFSQTVLNHYINRGFAIWYPGLRQKLAQTPQNLKGYWKLANIVEGSLPLMQRGAIDLLRDLLDPSSDSPLNLESRRELALSSVTRTFDKAHETEAMLDYMLGNKVLYSPEQMAKISPNDPTPPYRLKIPEDWAEMKEKITPETLALEKKILEGQLNRLRKWEEIWGGVDDGGMPLDYPYGPAIL
ncbi:MAG: hypothetical protein LBJ64_07865 [Deltaproteobacteria bacterium]|jgi:hypothetical protein|nr:hypothetical protein [Deltaproteobacteria bacterium]